MQELIITKTDDAESEYAFATSRDVSAVEVAARILESEGFTVLVKQKATSDGRALHFLLGTKPKVEVLH